MTITHTKVAVLADCPAFCVGSGEWNASHTIANCTITNAQLAGCVAYSKLAALTAGNILVGSMCAIATSVNPSGDVDISCTGAFTIANCSVSNLKLANMVTSRIKGRITARVEHALCVELLVLFSPFQVRCPVLLQAKSRFFNKALR